jgi:hypothetical protein
MHAHCIFDTIVIGFLSFSLICFLFKHVLNYFSQVCQNQLLSAFPEKMKGDLVTASSAKYPKNKPRQVGMDGLSWCAKVIISDAIFILCSIYRPQEDFFKCVYYINKRRFGDLLHL